MDSDSGGSVVSDSDGEFVDIEGIVGAWESEDGLATEVGASVMDGEGSFVICSVGTVGAVVSCWVDDLL